MTMTRRGVPFVIASCLALGSAPWALAADQNPSRQLIEAARSADVEGVKRLLATGVDPNRTPGLPPLMAAIVQPRRPEHLEIMRLLLAAGADVNGRAPHGGTALLQAAGFLDREAVALLLAAGADPNLVDRRGVSPLLASLLAIYDAEDRHLEIAQMLLARGADVNLAGPGPWPTPLFAAVRRHPTALRLILLLLDHGADPNARDQAGATPLMSVVQPAYVPPGTLDVIRLLVGAGADVNARDGAGRSVAAIAAASGNATVLPVLRDLGATDAQVPGATTATTGAPALLQSVRRSQLGEVRLLLAGGADPNVADAEGWTPLLHAAQLGDTDIVAALLARGARVDARNKAGATALGLAVQGRHYDITRALLAAGADVNAKDGAGDTPILVASRFKLVQRVRGSSAPGLRGVYPRGGRSPSTTVEVGPAPGEPGVTVETVRNMEPGLVALLLEAGADPNARDQDGLTALMYAAGQGRVELVRVLLARGADVEAVTVGGDRASTLAIKPEVMLMLREARGKRREPGAARPRGVPDAPQGLESGRTDR
jgi:ankyrin repeat protein